MGSMADNHTLGVLNKTDKGYRALVVFARQSNNLLICSKCTYNVNTMTHNTLQIEHYINHMGELDPMINITSLNISERPHPPLQVNLMATTLTTPTTVCFLERPHPHP